MVHCTHKYAIKVLCIMLCTINFSLFPLVYGHPIRTGNGGLYSPLTASTYVPSTGVGLHMPDESYIYL